MKIGTEHRRIAATAGLGALLAATALTALGSDSAEALQAKAPTPATLAFRNSVDTPLLGAGKPFQLSADYPRVNPGPCRNCAWLNVDVGGNFKFNPNPKPTDADWSKQGWDKYMAAILDYVREGQDPNLRDEVGFVTRVGGGTRWFNVPWMAYDPTVGREWRHGTTNERTASLEDLAGQDLPGVHDGAVHTLAGAKGKCRNKYFQTWSVGYYNPQGGYAIGRAIPRTGVPKVVDYMGAPMADGLPFPEGTLVVKILTSSATPDCVPFLEGSPVWRINRHVEQGSEGNETFSCRRAIGENRVVQVDVAVTDSRSPTGWVYGTYVYDGTSNGKTFWDRLLPLGVQWGADPWTYPAVPKEESLPLQQTVLNPGVKIFEHGGCRGRLAGPLDNAQSSCMSCHGAAYAARPGVQSSMNSNIPPAFGFNGMCSAYSADNTSYFQNMRAPQSFAGGKYPHAVSLDTSMQLQVAFQQYGVYATQRKPNACTLDGGK